MPDRLSLSRAARLADVSRGDLQARLKQLDIETFEGEIRIPDLLQAYPDIDMDADPTLERLARIRDNAFSNRGRKDSALPEAEVLMARLHDFQTVMTKTKAALNLSEELINELRAGLHAALAGDDGELRAVVRQFAARLDKAAGMRVRTNDREAVLFSKNALLSLISAHVKLLPSGNEFFVGGQDSLLEAALKSGLHPDYGCASGNCGKCKVRVLSGRVKPTRETDYVLSAREQEDGVVLACSNTAVTDLLVEAGEARRPADLPQQQLRARVIRPIALGGDLVLLQVRTPRTKTLRFMAGQRVQLCDDAGGCVELPLASCPCDGQNLEFLLSRVVQGAEFVDSLSANGATVQINGPSGEFLLHEQSDAPAVFISVGQGLSAIKSLIEHAIAIDKAVSIHLFRVDDLPAASHIDNLCRAWDDALDNLTIKRLRAGTTPDQALAELLKHFPGLKGCDLYLAGPEAWVAGFKAQAEVRKLPTERLRSDVI